jgi:hypothetical protein
MDAVPKRRWMAIILGRLVELVIVFVGVYAAFVLNAHQIREQQQQRRAQILTYLQKGADLGVAKLNAVIATYDKAVADFSRKLANGEMPQVAPIAWASSFNPNESAWLLQAGGLELLDIETIGRMNELDAAAGTGLSTMAHYQQLSDQLIVPHLGEGNAYFYDPATRQLRPLYDRYPEMLQEGSRVLHDMATKTEALAAQLRAEQQKRH